MTDWVGVDPGGRQTGLVCVRLPDRQFFHVEVIDRLDDDDRGEYLSRVLAAVAPWVSGRARLAVEDVVAPSPFLGMISVGALLDTAATVGALVGRWPEAVLVPPSGNGSAPLDTYPVELIGDREKVGGGRLRHARSAFDVTLYAHRVATAKTFS